jgi:hypothetical protein
MTHKHVVLGITLLTEAPVIVVLPNVTVLGVMKVLLDSLEEHENNSPDTMALAAIMNQLPCKPRFENLVGMSVINVNFCDRTVTVQCADGSGWQGDFDECITVHTPCDFGDEWI